MTWTTDYDCGKWQTRPLFREMVPHRQNRNFLTVTKICSWASNGAWNQDWLADWPAVVAWLWLWLERDGCVGVSSQRWQSVESQWEPGITSESTVMAPVDSGAMSRSQWGQELCELDRQHNRKKGIFNMEIKQILWCLLFVYCKQVFRPLRRSSSGAVEQGSWRIYIHWIRYRTRGSAVGWGIML
jgi:hypothetical protein